MWERGSTTVGRSKQRIDENKDTVPVSCCSAPRPHDSTPNNITLSKQPPACQTRKEIMYNQRESRGWADHKRSRHPSPLPQRTLPILQKVPRKDKPLCAHWRRAWHQPSQHALHPPNGRPVERHLQPQRRPRATRARVLDNQRHDERRRRRGRGGGGRGGGDRGTGSARTGAAAVGSTSVRGGCGCRRRRWPGGRRGGAPARVGDTSPRGVVTSVESGLRWRVSAARRGWVVPGRRGGAGSRLGARGGRHAGRVRMGVVHGTVTRRRVGSGRTSSPKKRLYSRSQHRWKRKGGAPRCDKKAVAAEGPFEPPSGRPGKDANRCCKGHTANNNETVSKGNCTWCEVQQVYVFQLVAEHGSC